MRILQTNSFEVKVVHQLMVTDQEIRLVEAALAILRIEVENDSEGWQPNEIEALVILSQMITKLREADQRRKERYICLE